MSTHDSKSPINGRAQPTSERPARETELAVDINALTIDMLRFALLLRVIRLPELAKNYEDRALWLRWDNPRSEDIDESRAWVRLTLKGGAGGLGDRYVHRRDGSVDEPLNQEYWELLGKMTEFANGVDAPQSDLLRQMDNRLFEHGYTYVRQIEAPVGRWPFRTGHSIYEVMTEPGVTTTVDRELLGGVVGYDPRGSRKDMEECMMKVHQLFQEGRSDEWVHFSSSQVLQGETLRNSEWPER